MELLSASRGFLKCNFHCHTTCSDGRLSPKDVMAAYRALDYRPSRGDAPRRR